MAVNSCISFHNSETPLFSSQTTSFLAVIVIVLLITAGCSGLSGSRDTEDQPEHEENQTEAAADPDFQPYSQELPETDITIDMVPVPGGTFEMGRSQEEGGEPREGPPREVKVDDFWMSKHELTWEQYDLFAKEVVDNEISAERMEQFGIDADAVTTPSPPYGDETHGMGRNGKPAVSMTHYAAVIYAMWVTGKTGEFHRLPTEAEWEYACRGGTADNYHPEGDEAELDNHEWYRGNSDGSYSQVATKEPNPLGLYDMLGNVTEWTMDEFHEDYFERLEGEPADNPWFKPEVLYPRTVRGGSYRDEVEQLRCTQRRGSEARWKRGDPQIPKSVWWHTNAPFVGIRLVRPKETPPKEEIEEFWLMPILDL